MILRKTSCTSELKYMIIAIEITAINRRNLFSKCQQNFILFSNKNMVGKSRILISFDATDSFDTIAFIVAENLGRFKFLMLYEQ